MAQVPSEGTITELFRIGHSTRTGQRANSIKSNTVAGYNNISTIPEPIYPMCSFLASLVLHLGKQRGQTPKNVLLIQFDTHGHLGQTLQSFSRRDGSRSVFSDLGCT